MKLVVSLDANQPCSFNWVIRSPIKRLSNLAHGCIILQQNIYFKAWQNYMAQFKATLLA